MHRPPHIPPPIGRLRVTPDEPAETLPAGADPHRSLYRPYSDATVRQVRHLIETTTLSQKAIARKTGVKPSTVSSWQRNYRWTRPVFAPRNPTIAALCRAGPALKLTLLTGRLVEIAERMTRELEDNPDTDIDKLMQALQAVRMARVTLQGNRRRKWLIGRARTGFEVMEEDAAIRAALKEMQRGGVDLDRAPKEAMDLVIAANTPAEPDHPALRPRGGRKR
jgi:transcriptional regulator with XRE-family HTH domain